MQFSLKIEGFEEIKKSVNPTVLRKALVSTLNKTGRQGSTAASKKIREKYNLKAGDIRKALSQFKAKATSLVFVLIARSKLIPLVLFSARQAAKGVTVKVLRKGGRKTIPHTFIATMPGGHKGVFERTMTGGKRAGRLPVREMVGISIADAMKNEEVLNEVDKVIETKAPAIFSHEFDYYSGRLK